jgi:hypothetical protein
MARRSAALRIVEGCNKALHVLEAATSYMSWKLQQKERK